MLEFTCSKCGQSLLPIEGDRIDFIICVACGAMTMAEKREQAKVTAAPPSDEGIRAGEPPVRPGWDPTTSNRSEDDPKSKPTVAGCFLTLLCVAVIFGSAVPIVTWRSPDSGLPLPRIIAITAPFLAGAVCYAVGAAILRLFGMPIFARPTRRTDDDK
jgi:hypothetical protein